jgi:hypothetical protein
MEIYTKKSINNLDKIQQTEISKYSNNFDKLLQSKFNEYLNNLYEYLNNLYEVTTYHVNLLLVDKKVSNYQMFVYSVNNSTYPIVYSSNYNSNNKLEFINKSFSHIERVAIISHGQASLGKFLNG